MNIFLLGATGATGRILLQNLLQARHRVTALVRNPDTFSDFDHPLLSLAKGDVFQSETFVEAMRGCDVVISTLGTGNSARPTTIYSEGGHNILTAMRRAGVKKLITLTSGGVQDDDPVIQKSFFYRYIGLWWLRHIYRDMKIWEALLDQTMDVNWVCIRPTYLRDTPFTGQYRVRDTYAPEGGWKIARADLADFIAKQITDNQFVHKKPVVAY
ncbi:MAG: SDR family oxidoreductase [Saprospiraceae bacterium]